MELRKISQLNVWDILRLKVRNNQKCFVAPNDISIIEAFAVREDGFVAMPFGIYEDGMPVGFAMLGYGATGAPEEPAVAENGYCLWRFMIDERFQGKGLGRKAMNIILDYIRTFPCGKADHCWLSYEPENTGAKALYNKMGFIENGEMCGGEIVAVKLFR
ncbi:MAG: GNAT family N-acetyltransferase [Clostridia bacterium]|nr:GNAT family N-acetyltransferase [Clostridia bacterium]